MSAQESYWNRYLAFSYTWRIGECKTKPRCENAESVACFDRRRSTRLFSEHVSRSVTDHKSSRYRRVALLSGTLLNAATVNVRLGGIPESFVIRCPSKDTADDQCGSIVASRITLTRLALRAFVFLGAGFRLQPPCKLHTLAGAL